MKAQCLLRGSQNKGLSQVRNGVVGGTLCPSPLQCHQLPEASGQEKTA